MGRQYIKHDNIEKHDKKKHQTEEGEYIQYRGREMI